MLKHIKAKDLVEFLAFGLGFAALVILASILESAPLGQAMWIAVVLSFFLWIVWGILTVRARQPRLMVWIDGRGWVDAMKFSKEDQSLYKEIFLENDHPTTLGKERTVEIVPQTRREARLFDQDEEAIRHLDFNQKEQA